MGFQRGVTHCSDDARDDVDVRVVGEGDHRLDVVARRVLDPGLRIDDRPEAEEHTEQGTLITGRVPSRFAGAYRQFMV